MKPPVNVASFRGERINTLEGIVKAGLDEVPLVEHKKTKPTFGLEHWPQAYCSTCYALHPMNTSTIMDLHGDRVCGKCAKESMGKCSFCGTMKGKGSLIQSGSIVGMKKGWLCGNCYNTIAMVCRDCDRTHMISNMTIVSGSRGACPNCIKSYSQCDVCKRRVPERRLHQETMLVDYTATELLNHDPTVPNLTPVETVHRNVCSYCRAGGGILPYSAPVNMPPIGEGKIHFGVELEVEVLSDYPFERAYERCKKDTKGFAVIKGDGSLDNGFEIVSAPMSLKEHHERWDRLFANKHPGLRSYDTSSCGMHVHVSRSGLSPLQIGKMLVFMNSRRNQRVVEGIANRYGVHYAQRKDKKPSDGRRLGEKYELISTRGMHTVEIRVFRGTLNRSSFMKNIEFAAALTDFFSPGNCGLNDCERSGAFLEFIRESKKSYPYLGEFLFPSKPRPTTKTKQKGNK